MLVFMEDVGEARGCWRPSNVGVGSTLLATAVVGVATAVYRAILQRVS